ncbi:hypothetical protein BaRGS_00000746, partial [Batillaria attramentaria]
MRYLSYATATINILSETGLRKNDFITSPLKSYLSSLDSEKTNFVSIILRREKKSSKVYLCDPHFPPKGNLIKMYLREVIIRPYSDRQKTLWMLRSSSPMDLGYVHFLYQECSPPRNPNTSAAPDSR